MTEPVLTIAEADYRYGRGPLRLRVQHVDRASPMHVDNEAWLWVDGVEVTTRGADLDPCRVLVRARSLPPGL